MQLLARTNPTLYDVLIALFGGAAGILEISRKKKGTVLAGVAIATALMPPLCTVGYGISVLSGKVILGALYLFLINGTFIALATFLVVKYLKFPAVGSEGKNRAMSGRAVAFILLIIVVPSVLTAVRVVKENNFNIHVSRLVEENKSIGAGFIYDYKVDNSAKPSTVELFLAGEVLTPDQKEVIFARAEKYGILRSQILFHEAAATTPTDNTLAESEIIKGLYEHMEARIRTLEDSIRALNEQLRLQQATHQVATPAPSDTTR